MKKFLLAAACAAILAGPAFAQTAAPAPIPAQGGPAVLQPSRGVKPPMPTPSPSTTPAPTPSPSAVAPKPGPSAVAAPGAEKPAHSAKSLDCSKQADAKGLRGKERKKFRSACKKG